MGETQALRPGLSARRLVDAFLSITFAPVCAACGEPLERPTEGPVCSACWRAVVRVTRPLCDRCGAPISRSSCASCARRPSRIARARSAGAYAGALRDILHAFKYGGRQSLASPLARLMLETQDDLLGGVAAAVPVPLHRARQRERGFNQAELLARELLLPLAPLLVRTRSTASQIDLPADRRHRNVRGAFALRPRRTSRVLPRTVVLVDDVVTTGATLNECARVLLEAGVNEVRAITVARAL